MSKSIFSEDLHIKGEVASQGEIETHGVVEGDVSARTLRTGKDAKIVGHARTGKAVLGGIVEGSVQGDRVTLTSSSKVRGELVANALSVDADAYFDGTLKRAEDLLKDD